MAKEKSITELRAEKESLKVQSNEMIAAMRKEERESNAEEKKKFAEIESRMREINNEILTHEEENRQSGVKHNNASKRFSLRRALANLVNNASQEDTELSVIDDATKLHESCGFRASSHSIVLPLESRANLTAAVESPLGVNIDESQQEMLFPLQNNLVMARAGARFMTNLVSDIYWPSYSGSTVAWAGENAASTDGAGTFSKGTVFKPLRLTAYAAISEQLLIQENKSVEQIITQTLTQAIAEKIEATAFSKAATVAGVPDGLFQTTPTIAGSLTWANIVAMETALDSANALQGNLAYILNPSLIGKAKTTVKDASGAGAFVFNQNGNGTTNPDGMLNGYNVFRSNNVPSGIGTGNDSYGAVFGNWNDYFIGQWGAIEIKTDPYTGMKEGLVNFVINSYWNMGAILPASFQTAALK